jgi:hypothetical protein
MRLTRWTVTALWLSSLLAAVAFLSGCSKPTEEEPFDVGGPRGGQAAKAKPITEYSNGVIRGKISLKGGGVPTADLNKRTDSLRAAMSKKDPQTCLAPGARTTYEDWIIGSDGGVANVVVLLKPEPGYYFALDDKHPGVQAALKRGQDLKTAFNAARGDHAKLLQCWESRQAPDWGMINQPHCAFIPHVATVFPSYRNAAGEVASTELNLRVLNTSNVSHNTAWGDGTSRNPGGDEVVPPLIGFAGKDGFLGARPSEKPITIKCSVHPWMQAYAWVTDHPFIAVTGEDGSFEIRNVPKEKMRLIVWHEPGEYLNAGGEEGEPLSVSGDGVVTKNYEVPFK